MKAECGDLRTTELYGHMEKQGSGRMKEHQTSRKNTKCLRISKGGIGQHEEQEVTSRFPDSLVLVYQLLCFTWS